MGKVLDTEDDDKELSDKLISWMASAFEQLNAAYQANRCSLRTKYEGNMRVGAVDHFTENQLGDGVNLLRPVTTSQTTWRWSPLFPDSDEVFELLDRKIPAQLFVLC